MAQRQPISHRRQPIQQSRQSRIARPHTLRPPTGGWNARDALDEMPDGDAVQLKNWFPQQSDCVSRGGASVWCDTGQAGFPVRTLINHEYALINKIIAAVNGKWFDVTTKASPSLLNSGYSSDYWVYTQMGGLTIAVNGVDVVQSFDGTTVAQPAFTGVTLSLLSYAYSYRSRLYFVEKNSQRMWYGGVGSVAGALSSFDFSTVASIKGNLMMISSLKGDGGSLGVDNVFLAIFTSGDILAYHGSNPGDSTNWTIIGKYKTGRPLSRFGIFSGDDDVYVATSRGYEKLSELSKYGQSAPERLLFSNKIQKAVSDQISALGASDDWSMFLYPRGQQLIINVPKTISTRDHHVQNINTGAWALFNFAQTPYCWSQIGMQPYFGGDSGVVYAYDDGSLSDNGTTILCDGQLAWSPLGYRGYEKQVTLVKPTIKSTSTPPVAVALGADFNGIVQYGPFNSASVGSLFYWGSCYWGPTPVDSSHPVGYWSTDNSTQGQWFNRVAIGNYISVRMAAQVTSARVTWDLTTVLFKLGGLL